MERVEAHFLVPIREDINVGGGDLQPYQRWENLQRDLYEKFGGWTLRPGLQAGVTQDPITSQPVCDKSKEYVVALEEKKIPELRRYLKEQVAVLFRQKFIYFFNGKDVEFLKNDESTEP